MAVIDDMAENEYLKNNLPKAKNKNPHYWIGLKENGTERYFSWTNGITFEYGKEFNSDPWGENQPDQVSLTWTGMIQSNAIIQVSSNTMTISYIIIRQYFVA